MAVENNVNIQSLANQYQTKVDYKVQNKSNSNAVDKTPDKDMVQLSSNKLSNKEKVEIGAAIATCVTLVTLAVLGRKGYLGEGVKKILRGKSKLNAVQETAEHTHTSTVTTQVNQGAETVAQEVKKVKDIINNAKIEDPVIKKALDNVSDIELVGNSSIPMMIDAIERGYYLEVLKILAKAENPQELSKAIQKLNKKSYNISGVELPKEFASKVDFDLLLKSQNEQLSKIGKQISFPENATPSEKFEMLMTAGLERGRKQTMRTIGTSYRTFEEGLAQKQDVSVFYDGIKKNINKAIDFLS